MNAMNKEYSLYGSHARELVDLFQTTLNLSQKQKVQVELVEVWNTEEQDLTQIVVFDASGSIITSVTMDIV